MKRLAALGIALMLVGCNEQGAVSAIEAYGFKDVRLTGFAWWGCDSERDNPLYNTRFSATSPNGKPVNGVACGGVLKGWTVRID